MRRIIICGFLLALVLGAPPAFISEPVMAMTGSGTAEDPYIIWNCTDLQNMSLDKSAYYELGQDIDCSCTQTWNWDAGRGVYQGFVPVGQWGSGFSGQLDGNFYTISNLYMDWYTTSSYRVGLFGYVSGNSSIIQNLYIIDANITGYAKGDDAGCQGAILVGNLGDADIYRVMVSGGVNVTSWDTSSFAHVEGDAGGLIGMTSSSDALVEGCASYADVYGFYDGYGSIKAGSFVGSAQGNVSDCYAMGSVSGNGYRGGFMGGGSGVDNCYSTGTAAYGFCRIGCSCADSFWDTETSGTETSACGTGKTTAEMQTESTFTDAGWDFDTVWGIGGAVNDGYPYLLWWYNPYEYPSDFTQVLWFQPNDIIEGTTLPDRAGNEDGIITWGANPTGITIETSPFYPEPPNPQYVFPDDVIIDPLDMVGPSGNPGWTGNLPTLETNPLYPLMNAFATETDIPLGIIWILWAILMVLLAMLLAYKFMPHLLVTAFVGGGLSTFFYHMGVFPFWVIFIFVAMALAVVIAERMPSIG